MFTRVVEFISKPGKSKELSSAINEKAVPILQKQGGFVDELLLVSNAEQDRVVSLSFWKTRDDAERYQRDQYKNVAETLRHLLGTEPLIRTFEMHSSSGLKNVVAHAA